MTATPSPALAAPVHRPWLQRFAVLTALLTLIVISAGGIVTTIGAGLSVPDWPTSYGTWWGPEGWFKRSAIRAEHGHRLLAASLGALIVALAIWAHVVGERRWVRHLTKALFLLVCIQGLLGGYTVLNFLPLISSATHGCLAQAIFCLVTTVAVGLTRTWERTRPVRVADAGRAETRSLAIGLFALVFIQLILGAIMRHMKDPLESVNPLAIPDFPLMFGALIPPLDEAKVVVHFLHRVGAFLILLASIALLWRARRRYRGVRIITVPATLLLLLVLVQASLGATVIWTAKEVVPTVAHVATGAAVLATAWLNVLFSWRVTAHPIAVVRDPSRAPFTTAESGA